MKYALLALLLSGCVGLPDPGGRVALRWVQLEPAELIQQCTPDANGCYKRAGSDCIIYTRMARANVDADLHRIVGHELEHCYRGYYHNRKGE